MGTGRRNLNSWFKWTEALKSGRLNVTETLRNQNAILCRAPVPDLWMMQPYAPGLRGPAREDCKSITRGVPSFIDLSCAQADAAVAVVADRQEGEDGQRPRSKFKHTHCIFDLSAMQNSKKAGSCLQPHAPRRSRW
jgi:hypothetical protein